MTNSKEQKVTVSGGWKGDPSNRNTNGRPKGASNKINEALKTAVLLSAHHAGHKVAMREELARIEKLREEADGRELTPEEATPKPELIEGSGLLTYLCDLAVNHPGSFAPLLGKVIHVQQQDEERSGAVIGEDMEVSIKIGFFPYRAEDRVIEHG